MNKIILAAERNTAPRGAKLLIVGPTGVGKTSLLRTTALSSTLFIDIEAGDLAVTDVAVDTVRPRTWPECRDLAVAIAGASPAVPSGAVYSAEHYAAVSSAFSDLDRYDTFFFDSLTAIGRLCFTWSSQQPESFSDRGKKDLRATYGLHAREMIAWLNRLQQARHVNVVLIGILEIVTDDFGKIEHRLQLEGTRAPRELPGIIDQIVTMHRIRFGDGGPVRAFICVSPNPWQYPAKDRSGRLDQIEQPHLGKLFDKLTRSGGDLVVPAASQSAQKQEVMCHECIRL
jgi:AAA domain